MIGVFRSLSARLFAILAVGLVFIQIASFGAFLAFRGNESKQQMVHFMGADVAFVFDLLRGMAPDERAAWLPRLNRGYYTFSLADSAALPAGEPGLESHRKIAPILALLRERLPHGTPLLVLEPPPREPAAQKMSRVQQMLLPLYCMSWTMCREVDEAYVRLLLRLDGRQTLVLHLIDPFAMPSAGTLALYMLAVFLAVTPFVWWAVRLTSRRIGHMLEKIENFGLNPGAPPVPETGPDELRRAAAAFNGMRWRILRHLEERTQILAAISHDLQTPLTRLRLRAEALMPGEARERIIGDVEHMAGLVGEGLDYARSAHLKEEHSAIEINHWLEGMVDDATDAGGHCELAGRARAPYSGALRALTRVMQNLIDNALKFGSRARIEIDDSAERLVIRVLDDGPGLPDALLEKVFEPFFRAETSRNRETGGSGLGLTIARNLARAHGGDIRLRNRPEGGLEAVVELPRGG